MEIWFLETSRTPCTPIISPTLISCDLSAVGLPDDGDYLLRVTTGNGESQGDEYDLTIGAVGPAGEDGADGADGVAGVSGYERVSTSCTEDVTDGVAFICTANCSVGKEILGGAVIIRLT